MSLINLIAFSDYNRYETVLKSGLIFLDYLQYNEAKHRVQERKWFDLKRTDREHDRASCLNTSLHFGERKKLFFRGC